MPLLVELAVEPRSRADAERLDGLGRSIGATACG